MRAPLQQLLIGLPLLVVASCRPVGGTHGAAADVRPGRGEFSVMTYNLLQYAHADRDGGGQEDDPKPAEARAAVVAVIASESPDVLAIQEIGSPEVFEELMQALHGAGLDYPHTEYMRRGRHEDNMAVLSRFPIIARELHTNDVYSIGSAKVPVTRGFIDVSIQVNEGYTFRLLVAHLKSKVFHPLGQTEMRRNEARLLNKHVRRALKQDPDLNLLVVGDMNDTHNSAALREVVGKADRVLFDLRPKDAVEDVWTWFSEDEDQYARIDYLLASRGMAAETVVGKTRVVRHPAALQASDHRPVVAVFSARDRQGK